TAGASRRGGGPGATPRGASSASQQAIGTGVIGGMLSATLAVVFVPVFFVVVMRVTGRGKATPDA
ncbi:hypothetical protein IAE35_14540, partial [Pseudomonas sp. S75]|uniref:hypothetical protein n=1 Tax=Pseudomonas sp. S75 TaxID=2767446 RepID=UPI00190B5CE7